MLFRFPCFLFLFAQEPNNLTLQFSTWLILESSEAITCKSAWQLQSPPRTTLDVAESFLGYYVRAQHRPCSRDQQRGLMSMPEAWLSQSTCPLRTCVPGDRHQAVLYLWKNESLPPPSVSWVLLQLCLSESLVKEFLQDPFSLISCAEQRHLLGKNALEFSQSLFLCRPSHPIPTSSCNDFLLLIPPTGLTCLN